MHSSLARAAGVLAALAVCGGLAGCAGAERLPECRGKAVPINSFIPAAKPSGRAAPDATVPESETDAL